MTICTVLFIIVTIICYHYYRLCYSIGASLLDSKLNRDLISMFAYIVLHIAFLFKYIKPVSS